MNFKDEIRKKLGKPIGETSMLKTVKDDDSSGAVRGFPPTTDSRPVGKKGLSMRELVDSFPKETQPIDFQIDFVAIAKLSSFQRFFVEALKKVVPGFENVPVRGSKEVMTTKFNQNLANYKEVMTELKMVLKKRAGKLKNE